MNGSQFFTSNRPYEPLAIKHSREPFFLAISLWRSTRKGVSKYFLFCSTLFGESSSGGGDEIGYSVSLSGNGNSFAVGVPVNDGDGWL